MRRILLTTLMGVSLAGIVKGQEMTGEKAEAIKKEIIKLEEDKIPILLKGGPATVDWIKRYDTDDFAYTRADGSTLTKAQTIARAEAESRSGVQRVVSNKQDDYHVRVYADGNTAVVTYHHISRVKNSAGDVTDKQDRSTDVFVRLDGAWRRVVHHVTDLPAK